MKKIKPTELEILNEIFNPKGVTIKGEQRNKKIIVTNGTVTITLFKESDVYEVIRVCNKLWR